MGIIFYYFGGNETRVVATGGFLRTWTYFQRNVQTLLFMANLLEGKLFYVKVGEDEWNDFREDSDAFLLNVVEEFGIETKMIKGYLS